MTTALAPNPLARLLAANTIPESKAVVLIETFAPYFATAGELAREAESINVTDAGQKDQIDAARALRLKVKKLRTTAEKSRKDLKDESLRLGKAIDGANGLLLEHILPVEAKLTEAEQFVERQEAELKASLKRNRENRLRPYVTDVTVFPLGELTDAAWDQLLEGSMMAHQKRIDDEAKARADAEAKAAADKIERDRLAAENARLQAERAEADRIAALERELAEAEKREAEEAAAAERKAIEDKAAAERAAHEALLKKEREAREQLERDAEAQRQKRLQEEREAAEAQARAEQAPDAEKLDALAATLLAVPMPTCTSRNARLAVGLIEADIQKLAEKCRSHAARLRS